MSSKLLKELKGVNFSCTSPASAAINTSTIQQSMLMNSSIGGRAIDRCSPHLWDPLRSRSLKPLLSQSQPQSPKINNRPNCKNFGPKNKKIVSEKKPAQPVSPASSQRYLLSIDGRSEDFLDSVIVNHEPSRFQATGKIEESTIMRTVGPPPVAVKAVKVEQSVDAGPSSSSSPTTSSRGKEQQVVVLRVSLHCKGCEGKVRKHISKMEGVSSFTTDLVNKKVTVVGDVTPLGVLNSISKVKNAQLWAPAQPLRANSK